MITGVFSQGWTMSNAPPRCRILVVEDHQESGEVLARLLSICGHEVDVATNFNSALDRAREQRYDVLVCDIGLPDGDGCELFKKVTAMYPVRGIAVTGYDSDKDVETCKAAGFSAHLTKPVMFEKVKSTLDNLCRTENEPAPAQAGS